MLSEISICQAQKIVHLKPVRTNKFVIGVTIIGIVFSRVGPSLSIRDSIALKLYWNSN